MEQIVSSDTLNLTTRDLNSKSAFEKKDGVVVVPVSLAERSYDIFIGKDLIQNAPDTIFKFAGGPLVFLVTDRNVGPKYGPPLAKSLQEAGFKGGNVVELPPGEGAKSLSVAGELYDRCFETGLDRTSTLIALGGGVIGDLTGFVAATYMRGIDFVQIPTTLLAQVDASVGGKTGIDHSNIKNGVGAFHQPRSVYIDPNVLTSLPEREFCCGMAEVVKYGAVQDAALFEFVETNLDKIKKLDEDTITTMVARSCEIKAATVSSDEKESSTGLRGMLNFGHTFGHALEQLTEFSKYQHGEAVAIGMVLAARTAGELKLVDADYINRLTELLKTIGLPTQLSEDDPSSNDLLANMSKDKKALGGNLRLILPSGLGKGGMYRGVDENVLLNVLKENRTETKSNNNGS